MKKSFIHKKDIIGENVQFISSFFFLQFSSHFIIRKGWSMRGFIYSRWYGKMTGRLFFFAWEDVLFWCIYRYAWSIVSVKEWNKKESKRLSREWLLRFRWRRLFRSYWANRKKSGKSSKTCSGIVFNFI